MMEVTFSINGRMYTISPSTVPIDTSLNTFIRSYARLTGTKFMCLEGGCGVCLVNITGFKSPLNSPKSLAVNSCLWLVYSCHGLSVTTIEGIGNREYGYHPIQTALWSYNGTQCGYCSPAMVMNMYSLLESNDGKVTQAQVENSFGGNICRCTGYRPILDAFKSLTIDAPIDDIEDANVSCCGRRKATARYRHVSVSRTLSVPISEDTGDVLRLPASDGKIWYRVENLHQLFSILESTVQNDQYILVAGDTAHGVYRRSHDIKYFIDINAVNDLHKWSLRRSRLAIGANISLNDTIAILLKVAADKEDFAYCKEIARHLDLVATVAVRNVGTIAGNLSIKHAHNEFPSDIFLLLETVGAKINIATTEGLVRSYTLEDYLAVDMRQKVILSIVLPKLPPNQFVFRSYKIMLRAQNAHAMVNAGFLFEFEPHPTLVEKTVRSCRICYGGIEPKFVHAEATEQLLTGVDELYTNENLQSAIQSLRREVQPDATPLEPPTEYRRYLAISLFYRFILSTAPVKRKIRLEFRSGAAAIERPISSGIQVYDTKEQLWPLTEPVLKNEGLIQCAGEAEYSNDLFSRYAAKEELWGAFVQATAYHDKIVKIDPSKALRIPGVYGFYTTKDIPGKNNFAPVKHGYAQMSEEEAIFVSLDSRILYNGQPCGMILANSMALANYAATQVKITYKKVKDKEPLLFGNLLSVIDAVKAETNQNEQQDIDSSITEASLSTLITIKGENESNTQFHYTMEPQTAFCLPSDDGGIDVYTSTQWSDFAQVAISECLQLPENKVHVVVKRVGGAYGGKLSRSSLVACACALGAYLTNMPVRFVLTIEAMMTICSRRYNFANTYNIAVDSTTGRIRSLNNFFVQDSGCSFNEETASLLENAFLLSYVTTRWVDSGKPLLSNTPGSGFCRAPGTTEGIAMVENIMEHIAHVTKLDAVQVRLANMPDRDLWKSLLENIVEDIDYYKRKREVERFNEQNRWHKRGIGFVQMQYPLDYIGALSAYVAIYYGDGTVNISHSGIECGQGINTKASQIAAYTLDIPLEMVNVRASNSETNPNSMPTAALAASDSICLATKRACEIILQRLKPIRDRLPENASWQTIVEAAQHKFVDLTAKYTFTPNDSKPYKIYGCACAEVEWDALTGNLQIRRVDVIEDTGRSMSPLVDVGQVEGSFIMGIGFWLTEKYVYDQRTGQLLTNRTWNYKTPGAKDIPIDFRVKFIETDNTSDRVGVLRSKATGEPAVTLAVVVVCALRHALSSVLKDNGNEDVFLQMGSGLTPDQLCLLAQPNTDDFLLE